MKKARIMHCDSGGSPIPSQVFYVQFNQVNYHWSIQLVSIIK